MEEIITIQVSNYLTNDLAGKISLAQWNSDSPQWINRIRRATYEDKYFYDAFDVVATNQHNKIIGRLHCIQNDKNKNLWYYGDLFVIPEYRRMGIARQMI